MISLARWHRLWIIFAKRPLPTIAVEPTEIGELDLADDLEPRFPVEMMIEGTPVSLQASANSREAWMTEIRQVVNVVLDPAGWATTEPVAVTIFYFSDGQMNGDIDNIVKPILDALIPRVYIDDAQVRRVWVEKFESDRSFQFENPSVQLASTIDSERPVVYIRVDSDVSLDDQVHVQ